MSMRDQISTALAEAVEAKDQLRISTLRLIEAAIHDRDLANRGIGRDRVDDVEIAQILRTMVKQREASAREFEANSRLEMAEEERAENDIIREFLPKQLCEDDTRRACAQVIDEVHAEGLRDVGRCMNALKQRFPGQLDVSKASGIVKTMLR